MIKCRFCCQIFICVFVERKKEVFSFSFLFFLFFLFFVFYVLFFTFFFGFGGTLFVRMMAVFYVDCTVWCDVFGSGPWAGCFSRMEGAQAWVGPGPIKFQAKLRPACYHPASPCKIFGMVGGSEAHAADDMI
jgi:hypothetical protein